MSAMQNMAERILLSNSVSLVPNQIATPTDKTRLMNRYNTAMLIHEVQFSEDIITTAAAGGAFSSDQGGIWASLKLGRIPLTRGWVPLSLLCPRSIDIAGHEVASTTLASMFMSCTWRFPKPLYVPANEYLEPSLHAQSYFSNINSANGGGAISVHISYRGTALPRNYPVPKEIDVP